MLEPYTDKYDTRGTMLINETELASVVNDVSSSGPGTVRVETLLTKKVV